MLKIGMVTLTSPLNPSGEKLKPDADGYYDVNVGALNFENTSGAFYKVTKRTLDCFTAEDSFLVKKIKAKNLYGEYDHPVMPSHIRAKIHTNAGKHEWMQRQAQFDRDYVSHHIKSVKLIETNIKDPITGVNKILMRAKIKPFGEKAQMVKDALETGSIAASFSIRSGAIETFENGRVTKEIVVIFTWDFVFAPGIPGSTDQATLGFEYDESDVENLITNLKKIENLSTEDADVIKCDLLGSVKTSTGDEMYDEW